MIASSLIPSSSNSQLGIKIDRNSVNTTAKTLTLMEGALKNECVAGSLKEHNDDTRGVFLQVYQGFNSFVTVRD